MKTFTHKCMASLLAAICAALVSGCSSADLEPQSSVWSIPDPNTISAPPQSSSPSTTEESAASSEDSPESSAPESTGFSTQQAPEFSFTSDPALPVPEGEGIRIRSLSEALAGFSAISDKPAEGSPEEIVKTLLERNILCFAAMQGKCWTYGESTGGDPLVVPIYSEHIKSVEQMTELFADTYTENQAWRLFHPQQVDGYGDVFQYDDNGALCFDLDHLRRKHMDSFETATYAAVIKADDSEITFGRYYESKPAAGAVEPNNMHFRAVREYGEWRLDTYITDAPAFAPLYTELKPTKRVGNPGLMELAKEQVGNIGGAKYWEWYGFGEHIEWCGAFVSWCYNEAGKDGPFFTACNSEGAAWFKRRDQWGDRGYPDIAPGDSIFFDWDEEGSADHVGLVLGTDGEYVYTIEGNRDDVCITRGYELNSRYILGYGLMDWSAAD